MTVDEAVAFIQQQMGFRTALTSQITTTIQRSIVRVEDDESIERADFLLQEHGTDGLFVTTVGSREVTIPDTFLGESESAGALYIYDSTLEDPYVELSKAEPWYVRGNYVDSEQPAWYGVQGNKLIFGGIPDAEYQLRWFAYFRDNANVSGGDTNLWLTRRPFLIIAEAGVHIASASRSPSVDYFSDLLKSEKRAHNTKMVAAQEDAAPGSRGGDD